MLVNAKQLSVGRQIRLKRVLEGITQTDLAQVLGMNRAVLSRVENEKADLPKRYKNVVQEYLETSVYKD